MSFAARELAPELVVMCDQTSRLALELVFGFNDCTQQRALQQFPSSARLLTREG